MPKLAPAPTPAMVSSLPPDLCPHHLSLRGAIDRFSIQRGCTAPRCSMTLGTKANAASSMVVPGFERHLHGCLIPVSVCSTDQRHRRHRPNACRFGPGLSEGLSKAQDDDNARNAKLRVCESNADADDARLAGVSTSRRVGLIGDRPFRSGTSHSPDAPAAPTH